MVFTATGPLVAPLGTVVEIALPEITVNAAGVPLKSTLVALVRLFPRIKTEAPTLPEAGSVSTNGPKPTETSKTVPSLLVPPWKVAP